MMASVRQPRPSVESYEYTVYTFQHCDRKQEERWQLQDSFETAREALYVARNLFESGQFCRVEVKEKYTNSAVGRISDTTLKVFAREGGLSMRKFLSLLGIEE